MARTLLAVDLGVRTGLAVYGDDGRLRWYRSHNFGNAARLRRGVPGVLEEAGEVAYLVIEGGGTLASGWTTEAAAREIEVLLVSAEGWRELLFYPREHRTGEIAKRRAGEMARKIIEWSGARKPTSLRHDAAEAILAGLWGVLQVGWLSELPVTR